MGSGSRDTNWRWRGTALFVAGVCASAVMGCGAPPEPATPSGGEVNWAEGAPSVSPKYTEEDAARLYLCPFILTAVVAAGHSKDSGLSLEKVQAEIDARSIPGDAKDLASMFAKQTYADTYTDLIQYAQSTNEQCVEKVGSITGPRSERALFCLGRHLTALAGFRLHKQHSMAELAARLGSLPGYSEEALQFGYGGKPPPIEGWVACAESQP